MNPDTALLYAVRRKCDDWYYKKTKSAYLKKWDSDDQRRKHWTPDANEASFYPLLGIKSILGSLRGSAHRTHVRLLKGHNPNSTKDLPGVEEYEVVRFVCTEQPEVVPTGIL